MRFQITKTHRINIYKQYVSVIAVVCHGLLHEGMYFRAEYSVIAFSVGNGSSLNFVFHQMTYAIDLTFIRSNAG